MFFKRETATVDKQGLLDKLRDRHEYEFFVIKVEVLIKYFPDDKITVHLKRELDVLKKSLSHD